MSCIIHREIGRERDSLLVHSEGAWRSLLQRLSQLSSTQANSYSSQPETVHYVHRLLCHVDSQSERLSQLGVREHLHAVFPTLVESAPVSLHKATRSSMNAARRTKEGKGRRQKQHRRAVTFTATGTDVRSVCGYSSDQLPVTFRGSQLSFKDLAPAVDSVHSSILSAERSAHHPVTHNLPPRPHTSQGFHHPQRRPLLLPLLNSDLQEHPCPSLSSRQQTSPLKVVKVGRKVEKLLRVKGLLGGTVQNGEEVVRAFASGQLGPNDEVYLNFAELVPWDSYKMVVVSRRQAKLEHFVASSFGFLHVYPDGEVERQSYAEWSRDASICNIIRQIPIFRDYLLSKMLHLWRRNVCQLRFSRKRSALAHSGLRFHPPFFYTLWKIKSLCEDLLTVEVTSVTPVGGYKGEEFQRQIQADHNKLQKLLNRYFKYCQRTVTESVRSSQSVVTELETRQKHQPFISDLPISVQKEQHKRLEDDLEESRHRERQLGALMTLVRLLMLSCLKKFQEQASSKWVWLLVHEEAEEEEEDCRDEIVSALLSAELKFSATGIPVSNYR